MERIDPQNETKIVLREHYHRYDWANKWTFGNVCDIACGNGYGSFIVKANNQIHSYIGYDISEEAIAYARNNYSSDNIRFELGNCYSLDLEDHSIDTIISLETLEHLDNPSKALDEFQRILKPEGLMIGSVPTSAYEETCTEVYGPNPYHLQQFSESALKSMLENKFKYVMIYNAYLSIVSTISKLDISKCNIINDDLNSKMGSFLFLATNSHKLFDEITSSGDINDVEYIMPLVEYDRIILVPRNKTISDQTKLIDERDSLIKKQDQLIIDKDNALSNQTKLIDERDSLIKKQDEMIIEKNEILLKQEIMIRDRDEAITTQTLLIDERDRLVKYYEEKIMKLNEEVNEKNLLINNYEETFCKLNEELDKHNGENNNLKLELENEKQTNKELEQSIKKKDLILKSVRASLKNAIYLVLNRKNKE
ncbi:class I SAM-dependent methyltransferase [Paenibacillus oleatilyticus]|uniref:class I SAM-dependent methyltransferase n=1 Tax=Paenibacillus oleatilyticus TaxID=2594886 RepID=UPI001C200191|nr:class I SAM-dependent methyltransferase [Paenibacillus oleatilyticus]MBU7319745.1 methyltransferase domain-containing protein [Paenibacillus oleatilyticus]